MKLNVVLFIKIIKKIVINWVILY